MKTRFLSLLFLVTFTLGLGELRGQNHKKLIKMHRAELNAEFADPKKSPLTAEDLKSFKGLPFYPFSEVFRVEARFIRSDSVVSVAFATTTARMPLYDVYGYLEFDLGGLKHRLTVYQSQDLRNKPEYQDYLFLPFTDQTNGDETYGGGRYLDLRIFEGNTVWLDFNKAYSPYCAFNSRYSCPLVPASNHLALPIRAGMKNWK